VTPARRVACAAAVLLSVLLSVLPLAACSDDPNSIAAQAREGSRKGYVSGDGSVERLALEKRQQAVSLTGTTLAGQPLSIGTFRGSVVVINVWGSWCGPCEAEAPQLKRAYDELRAAGKPVHFVGIDYREDPQRGLAAQKRHGLEYPSLSDESGVLILSLQGKAPTVPTTLVLDRDGRIAARVSGPITASTLTGLVDDTLSEPAA
jgi:thiol-disulfide isomerase/thioredoxin